MAGLRARDSSEGDRLLEDGGVGVGTPPLLRSEAGSPPGSPRASAGAQAAEFVNVPRRKHGHRLSTRETLRSLVSVSLELRVQLLAVAIYGFTALAKNLSFFPFSRTTIECQSAVAAEDPSSVLWSGSLHCTDQRLVAREAQFLKGLAEGLDQLFHCMMLPLLGHAIDCFGRRWGILVGMSGITLQCACFFVAAELEAGGASQAMIIVGSIAQGVTGIFMASVNASVRDVQNQMSGKKNGAVAGAVAGADTINADTSIDGANVYVDAGGSRSANVARSASLARQDSAQHDSHAFGAMQISQGVASSVSMVLVTAFVIARNLVSYVQVWFVFFLLAGFSTLMLYCTFPETLRERQRWTWRKASPLSLLDLFRHGGTQRWVALMVFFELLSLSAISTLQAFTVAEYKWTQTFSTVIFTTLTPLSVVSLGASFALIPRFGPWLIVEAALVMLNLGMLSFCFASLGPAFVFVGIGCIFSTMGSFPALMEIITGLAEPNEVGQLLANTGAVALAAVAIGNVFYGAVFRASAEASYVPFLVASPLMFVALLCACKASSTATRAAISKQAHAADHLDLPL